MVGHRERTELQLMRPSIKRSKAASAIEQGILGVQVEMNKVGVPTSPPLRSLSFGARRDINEAGLGQQTTGPYSHQRISKPVRGEIFVA